MCNNFLIGQLKDTLYIEFAMFCSSNRNAALKTVYLTNADSAGSGTSAESKLRFFPVKEVARPCRLHLPSYVLQNSRGNDSPHKAAVHLNAKVGKQQKQGFS